MCCLLNAGVNEGKRWHNLYNQACGVTKCGLGLQEVGDYKRREGKELAFVVQ